MKKLNELHEKQEKNSKNLTDLYIKKSMQEEEIEGIKNTIQKYKDMIEEYRITELKLPKSLTKAVIISMIPIIIALFVSMGVMIFFHPIKEVTQIGVYSAFLTGLTFTPASILIGTKEYIDLKKNLKNNNIESLKLILEREIKIKEIILEEYKETNKSIKIYEEEKRIIESLINEMLNLDFKKEEIIENVEQSGKQKIKK